MKNFRDYLYELDPSLLLEGDETVLDNDSLYMEIQNILEHMSDDEIDEFGAFLAVEFFDTPEEEVEDVYFELDNVLEMINDLGSESYNFLLDLLLPEEFPTSDDDETEYVEIDGDYELDEAVSRVMKVTKLNKKKRKFFKKSAAELRKERAERVKKNRLTKASRRAYRRANISKLKAYQKSRKTFVKKGRHFVKIRRKGGAEA